MVDADEQEAVRLANATNSDPRARRTRRKLVEAFLGLVDDAGPAQPMATPAELSARAGVNRTTFYAHFASTDDLAVEALSELFEIVASSDAAARMSHRSREASRSSLYEVAAFVDARRDVYGHLLTAGQGRFRSALELQFVERNRQTLAAMPHLPSGVDAEVTARWIAAAVLGVLGWWCAGGTGQDGRRPTVDELADTLAALLPEWFLKDSRD